MIVPRPNGCVMILSPFDRLVKVPLLNLVVTLVSPASPQAQTARIATVKRNFMALPYS